MRFGISMNSKPGSATSLLWASEQVTYFQQFIIFQNIQFRVVVVVLIV